MRSLEKRPLRCRMGAAAVGGVFVRAQLSRREGVEGGCFKARAQHVRPPHRRHGRHRGPGRCLTLPRQVPRRNPRSGKWWAARPAQPTNVLSGGGGGAVRAAHAATHGTPYFSPAAQRKTLSGLLVVVCVWGGVGGGGGSGWWGGGGAERAAHAMTHSTTYSPRSLGAMGKSPLSVPSVL